MDEQQPVSDRTATTARVMKSLSRLLTRHDVLPVRRPDRTAPIVIALPDDAVGDVGTWVHDAGGCANVILAERDGFLIWAWDTAGIESIDAIDVAHHSTMAMLRLWVEQNPDEVATFNVLARVAEAKELEYQF